jgi:hydrogenase 3 maturation protease
MDEKKTSNNSWKVRLSQLLVQVAETKRPKNLKPEFSALRVAVVGVGNELNGDDAAGISVARNLWADREIPACCFKIETGSLPENASGPLRRFHPDLVIFVDAAEIWCRCRDSPMARQGKD